MMTMKPWAFHGLRTKEVTFFFFSVQQFSCIHYGITSYPSYDLLCSTLLAPTREFEERVRGKTVRAQ